MRHHELRGTSHRRKVTPTGLSIPGKAHKTYQYSETMTNLELGKFSPTEFKMKLAIFAFALLGAVLASAQEKIPAAERADGE